MGLADRLLASEWQWQGLQPCQGSTEQICPGPVPWEMQSEATRRAGEPVSADSTPRNG